MKTFPFVVLLFVVGCAPTKENPNEQVKQIVAHKWWKKPPSEPFVRELIAKIVATNDDHMVYIDDEFRVVTRKERYTSPLSDSPDGVGKRHFRVIVTGYKRWDADEATERLLSALTSAEFSDGPGR